MKYNGNLKDINKMNCRGYATNTAGKGRLTRNKLIQIKIKNKYKLTKIRTKRPSYRERLQT